MQKLYYLYFSRTRRRFLAFLLLQLLATRVLIFQDDLVGYLVHDRELRLSLGPAATKQRDDQQQHRKQRQTQNPREVTLNHDSLLLSTLLCTLIAETIPPSP